MLEAETVFIIPTARGTYPVLDVLQGIRWSCANPYYVIVADRKGDVVIPDNPGVQDCTVLNVRDTGEMQQGFVAGLAIKWAIDQGARAQQFVILDDECLILQKGLDKWSLNHLEKTQVGVLGVLDRDNHTSAYQQCSPLMDSWGMPHGNFEPDSYSLADPILFLAAEAGRLLYDRNLLTPAESTQWPVPHATFISWAVQMCGLYQIGWGHLDKQMPPIYVNNPERGNTQPAPHILSSRFMLYHSVRHIPGYSEENLREAFKRMRGEPGAKVMEPVRPVVSPQQRGPTVLG